MSKSWPERVHRARKQLIALADDELKNYGRLSWSTEVMTRGEEGLKVLRQLTDEFTKSLRKANFLLGK
jgi:hypothetical protein